VTTAAPSRILLRGGLVASCDPAIGDVRDCDVLIEDGLIAAVGPALAPPPEGCEVIDASSMIALPGFIDTHRHNWQAVFRGIGADWPLSQYRAGIHGLLKQYYQPEDIYIGNLLGRLEALQSGITTMLDWCHAILSPDHADAAVAGLLDAPGRSVFAYGAGGRKGNAPSAVSIEADVRRVAGALFPSRDQLVTLALGLRGPQYSTFDTVEADVALARELDLPVTMHGGSANIGRGRPVGQMAERGLLDERTTVIHCNTLADDELSLMADHGCSASISPWAEVQMGFGWPATGRLRAAGIRPSLSIDDCVSTAGDMFSTMRATLVTQRGLDAAAVAEPENLAALDLSCQDVVEFATIEGARACGLSGITGSISPGKQADILLLRADDLSVFPATYPAGVIASMAHPGLIDIVLVHGQVVLRDGRLVGLDLEKIRSRALASRDRILAQAQKDHPGAGIRLDGRWSPDAAGVMVHSKASR
jgi:5-methylthioadenosine/S-adenosylhomocysteine deaminase